MKKILILCVGIFLFSCSNENVEINKKPENKLFSIEDYFKLVNSETKHSVFIQNFTSLYTSNTLSSITGKSNERNSGIALRIDATQFDPSNVYTNSENRTSFNINDVDLSNMYGKNVKIAFNTNKFLGVVNSTVIATNVYIPKILKLNYSNLTVDEKVKQGTIISWNLDEHNTKGIVLALEYNPMSQSDALISSTYPDNIMNGKTVEDKGSYTITAEDLMNYPDNASLVFYVGRANVSVINDGNPANDLSVVSFTVNNTGFKIDKPK